MSEKRNPLLDALLIPGETFRLPSQGLFYKDGEIDESVKMGEVHVHPMTALHELVMKSPDKLFSGKAVNDVFSKCIPEVLQPSKLLAKDVDYLLMCLRVVTYGDILEMSYTHNCKDAKEHSYKIDLREVLRRARAIDPTSLKKYKLKLENGQVVSLRPPRYDSVIALYQALDNSLEKEDGEEEIALRVIENLASMIESVNDTTDHDDIYEWLTHLRAGWIKDISDKIAEVSDWGVEQTCSIVCKDCNNSVEVEVPTNPITFFM